MQDAFRKRFGRWLRDMRHRRGWSQDVIGAKVGIKGSQVSRVENGKANVPVEQVQAYARELNAAQVFALIEAGYLTDLATEDADIAVRSSRLTGERRSALLAVLAAMETEESARTQRGG
jgi:transcriptional regulator with XRE-family HTH domain